MNTLKTIITIIAISLSTVFSTAATENNPEKVKKTLRSELVSLLGDNISLKIDKNYSAEILFIVNNANEVVVVSVNSKLEDFNKYAKSRLNYKKIAVKNIKKGEIYKMPIKINKK
ncbi:MAG: hypothetical protein ABJH82_07275 [Polaribacter sp.]|uniref:hypothetical protein n=1 Tax=Polaribacter sp. TaxID=1920175 RepID=UPI003264915C